MDGRPPHIGTLREKPLHASLKQWYSRPGDGVEVPVGDFVVDLVRDDLLIEIQTRGFASMKAKVRTLVDLGHRLRIVYPTPVNKWIVKVGDDSTILSKRRSPIHGQIIDVFRELVSFPDLLVHPLLEIEVALVEEEEIRRHTPGRSWRRKGWSVEERRLIGVIETRLVAGRDDLLELVPGSLPDRFTTSDLAEGLGSPRRTAQQMAYCLRKAGVIDAVGKRGNSIEYEVVP